MVSLKQRIAFFEQELLALLSEVWQIEIKLKKTRQNTESIVSLGINLQQLFDAEVCVDFDNLFVDENQETPQQITGIIITVTDDSIIIDPGNSLFSQMHLSWLDYLPHSLLDKCLQRLQTKWTATELGNLAADMYFNPMLWQDVHPVGTPRYEAIIQILNACIVKFYTSNICDRLTTRLQEILASPFYPEEVRLKQRWGICCVPYLHLAPGLHECLELLLALPPTAENLDLTAKLILGEMDFGSFDPSPYFGAMTFAPPNSPLYTSNYEYEKYFWQQHFDALVYSRKFDSCKQVWAYQIYGHRYYFYTPPGLCEYFPRLMQRLYEHGRFSYAAFCQCVQHLPVILAAASNCRVAQRNRHNLAFSPTWEDTDWHTWKTASEHLFHTQVSSTFSQVVLQYCDQLAWETAQNLSSDNYNILTQIKGLRGSRYLLQAVQQHSKYQLGKILYPYPPKHEWELSKTQRCIKWRAGVAAAVIHLAQATETAPHSPAQRQALVTQLKTFPASSLKYLLPIAQHSYPVLAEALGWQQALPLIDTLNHIAIQNNTDIDLTVVAAFRNALVQAGEALAREVWTLWHEAKVFNNNTVFLIEATFGWNRTEVEKSLSKRKQFAVKAVGLLPLKRGKDEIIERYLFLQQFRQESKQFGAQRQASEVKAVKTALTYLAQVAGYADPQSLECLIATNLNQKIALDRIWSINDYRVELTFSKSDLQLTIYRGNKQLKSVPAVVRQSKVYAQIKNIVKELRSQITHFRHNFEEIMATGQPLSCEELTSFSQMPITRGMLEQLVLYTNTDDRTCGLFAADAMAVRTINGSLMPIINQVYIAHPYHLFHRDELAAWQQEIVRQRIVQPFKQVFRELYLLTPAEQETRNYSHRFAGHVLDSRVTAKLLQSRGWQIANGEYAAPCKVFTELGLEACFEFSDIGHYISETDVITSDRIYFQTKSCQFQVESQWLALSDIPPVIFSEVMRDADLVVSVAQRQGEVRLSAQTYQQRGNLVELLLADLGLPNVNVEGHFAYVQGKLARYRVHLGSAAIHIEPGHYLCIVPERYHRKQEIFLPFADQSDSKIAEVISKILLLANDDKIKEQRILQQMQAYTHTPQVE